MGHTPFCYGVSPSSFPCCGEHWQSGCLHYQTPVYCSSTPISNFPILTSDVQNSLQCCPIVVQTELACKSWPNKLCLPHSHVQDDYQEALQKLHLTATKAYSVCELHSIVRQHVTEQSFSVDQSHHEVWGLHTQGGWSLRWPQDGWADRVACDCSQVLNFRVPCRGAARHPSEGYRRSGWRWIWELAS